LTTDGQIISAQDGLDISKMDQSEVQSEVTTHPDTDIGKKDLSDVQSEVSSRNDGSMRNRSIDLNRIAWYRQESKTLVARPGKRCGIFLHIDGVLHPCGSYGGQRFALLPLLRQLLESVECDLVLSSSCRTDDEGIQEINDRLQQEFPGDSNKELLDITLAPHEGLNDVDNRDKEIMEWLSIHGNEVGWGDRWIAVGDIDLSSALGVQHVVVIDRNVGLTPAKVNEAIRKLSGCWPGPGFLSFSRG
jgi:hypothetical protein